MWNHQSQMHNAMAARGIAWPQLTSQDLDDMLVYLQNLPQTRGEELSVDLPSGGNGKRYSVRKAARAATLGSWRSKTV